VAALRAANPNLRGAGRRRVHFPGGRGERRILVTGRAVARQYGGREAVWRETPRRRRDPLNGGNCKTWNAKPQLAGKPKRFAFACCGHVFGSPAFSTFLFTLIFLEDRNLILHCDPRTAILRSGFLL